MPNSHVPTSYVAEPPNATFDIWRAKWNWIDKKWNKCTMYTDTRGTKFPIYIELVFLSPKFQSVLLHGQPVWVRNHFGSSGLNDTKTILNTTRSKTHHVCVTSAQESQISVRFAPYSVFTTFWPTRPKFWSVLLYCKAFSRYSTVYKKNKRSCQKSKT